MGLRSYALLSALGLTAGSCHLIGGYGDFEKVDGSSTSSAGGHNANGDNGGAGAFGGSTGGTNQGGSGGTGGNGCPDPPTGFPATGQTACYYYVGGVWTEDPTCSQSYSPTSATHPYGQDAHYACGSEPRAFTGPTQYGTDQYTTSGYEQTTWTSCYLGLSGHDCNTGTATYFENYCAAAAACKALNEGNGYGGLYGWRLPTLVELLLVVDYSDQLAPAEYFPNADAMQLWTYVFDQSGASVECGAGGGGGSGGTSATGGSGGGTTTQHFVYPLVANEKTGAVTFELSGSANVRCVRTGQAPPTYAPLDVRPDGTAASADFGLMWTRCRLGETWSQGACSPGNAGKSWAQAVGSCTNLSFSGYSDWRLPNVLQIATLLERHGTDAFVDTAAFPSVSDTGPAEPWLLTSTTAAANPTRAFIIDFAQGQIQPHVDKPGTTSYGICVRPYAAGSGGGR